MPSTDATIRLKARMAGLFYLLTILAGIFAEGLVSGRLVTTDPAATARNILANANLLRLGYAVYLVEMASNVAMIALFYDLLRPVSRNLSFLAAAFGLVGCTIKAMSRMFFYAPLLFLDDSRYAASFGGDLPTLVHMLLRLNAQAAGMALVFFGFQSVVKGWLILRSTFLPRFLGALSVLGGIGWLTFLSPPLGNRLFAYVALVGVAGSLATILWLLIRGVDARRWKEQALASGE